MPDQSALIETLQRENAALRQRIAELERAHSAEAHVSTAPVDGDSYYRLIVDTLSEGVTLNELVRDKHGAIIDYRILEVNPAFAQIAHYHGPVVGALATQIYDLPSDYIAAFWQSPPLTTTYTEIVSSVNGRRYSVSTSPLVNDRFVTSFVDLTERRQVEQALRWYQSLLHAMADSLPLAFLVVDNRTDEILYFNQRFCQLWGIEHLAERMRRGELKNNDIIPDCLAVVVDVPAFAASCKPLQDEANREVVEDEIAFTQGRTIRRFSTQIRGEQDEYYGRFYIFEDISQRKCAEEALRESEANLHAVFNATDESILLVEADGTLLAVNDVAAQRLGHSRADLRGRNIVDLLPPKVIAHRRPFIDRALLSGESVTFEDQLNDTWESNRVYPVLNAAGQVIRLAIFARDITERKQAEEAQATLALRHQTLLQTASDGIHVIDDQGNLVEANAKFCAMLGYTRDELLHLNVADWDVHWPVEELRTKIHKLLAQPSTFETRHRRKDGTLRQVEINAVGVRLDGLNYLYASARDITDRKQMEEALRASEERFRNMFMKHAAIMLIVEPDTGAILEANYAAEQFYGYPLARLCTLSITDLNQLPFDQVHGERQRALREERNYFVFPHCLANGDTRIVEVHSSPIALENKRVLFSIIHDISDRTQAEEALRASETLLRTLIDALPERIFAKDAQSRFTLANAAEIRLDGGASFDDLRGKTDFDFYPIDLAQQYYADEQHLLTTGQPLIGREERNLDQAAGTLRWQLITKMPLHDATGRITGLVGTSVDITARKQMEEALRASEQKHRLLFETMAQGVIYYNASGKVISANPAAEQILGMTLDQLQGKSFVNPAWKVVAADGTALPPDEHPITVALRTGQPITHFNLGIFNPNHNVHRWLSVTAIPLFQAGEEKPVQVYSTFEDITARKEAEEALRESEEKFRTIIQQSSEGVILLDEQGLIIEWNPAQAQITGISQAEAIGQPAWEIQVRQAPIEYRTPAQIEYVKQVLLNLLATGQSPVLDQSIEGTIESASGEQRHVIQNNFLIKTAHGYRVGAIVHDITQRKRMEQALRESAANLSAAFDATDESILLLAPDGSILALNAITAQRMGQPRENLIGRKVHNLAPAEVVARRQIYLERVLCQGKPVTFEDERDGRWLVNHFYPVLDANGRVARVMVDSRDITERKQTEEALRRQHDFLATLFATSLDLLNRRHVGDLLQAIVERAAAILDAPYGELDLIDGDELVVEAVTANQAHLKGERTRRQEATLSWQAHDTGQVAQVEDYSTWPAHRTVYDAMAIHAVADFPIMAGPNCLGVLGLGRTQPDRPFTPEETQQGRLFSQLAALVIDNAQLYTSALHEIGERQRVENVLRDLNATLEQRVAERTAELQAANVRLTELDRLKDEFLSRISHELRTPLSGILLALELLETAKPEKRERYVQRLKDATFRLRDLIEDVLTFSQLNRTFDAARLSRLDVNDWLEGRVSMWQSKCAVRNLALQLDLSPDLPQAMADPDLVLQVVARLLTNAVNYTPAGTVTLSTALCAEADGRWVTICVTDTGPGIAAIDLPHIFERFYRGQAAADFKTPGTGIGLAISREIAERLGGRLTVETQVGVGSTFTLWLRAI